VALAAAVAQAQPAAPAGGAQALALQLREALRAEDPNRAPFDELVALGAQSVPAMEALLKEEDAQLRLAGAMVLALIAEKNGAAEMAAQLKQAAGDSSPGVAYWGYYGLLRSKALSEKEFEEWALKSLGARQPYPVRILGCDACGARQIKAAAPWLAMCLVRRTEEYLRLKAEMWVLEEEEKAPAAEAKPKAAAARPGMEGVEAAATTEAAPVEARRYKRPITEADYSTSRRSEVIIRGQEMEQTAVVLEIRSAGIALEKVVGQDFGFTKLVSWELRPALDRAREWYEQHKGEYAGGPQEEAAKPAEDAAPAGEAKPKAAPAPAAAPAAVQPKEAPAPPPARPGGRGGRGVQPPAGGREVN